MYLLSPSLEWLRKVPTLTFPGVAGKGIFSRLPWSGRERYRLSPILGEASELGEELIACYTLHELNTGQHPVDPTRFIHDL